MKYKNKISSLDQSSKLLLFIYLSMFKLNIKKIFF